MKFVIQVSFTPKTLRKCPKPSINSTLMLCHITKYYKMSLSLSLNRMIPVRIVRFPILSNLHMHIISFLQNIIILPNSMISACIIQFSHVTYKYSIHKILLNTTQFHFFICFSHIKFVVQVISYLPPHCHKVLLNKTNITP